MVSDVKVANCAPTVSKLFYVDDVMLFCNASMSQVRALMNCLTTYCEWSTQCFIVENFGVFGSKGVHVQFFRQGKGDNFGFKKLQQGVKYLGVPLFLTTNKFKDFEFVKERLEARVAK